MGNISAISKIIEIIPKITSENTDGSLGHFTVSTAIPSDIAKAAALQYHDFDINSSHSLFKFVIRRKGIKSKFAKKNDADEEDGDFDVDEATREESAPNETQHRRLLNSTIAQLAQGNADIINRIKTFGR